MDNTQIQPKLTTKVTGSRNKFIANNQLAIRKKLKSNKPEYQPKDQSMKTEKTKKQLALEKFAAVIKESNVGLGMHAANEWPKFLAQQAAQSQQYPGLTALGLAPPTPVQSDQQISTALGNNDQSIPSRHLAGTPATNPGIMLQQNASGAASATNPAPATPEIQSQQGLNPWVLGLLGGGLGAAGGALFGDKERRVRNMILMGLLGGGLGVGGAALYNHLQ